MYKIVITKGYFNGCVGIVEGFHFNKAIVKIEVNHHNKNETVNLLLGTKEFTIIETID